MLTKLIKVPTGQMQVAVPEVIVFDMVRYPAACGYWNNILTVLEELHEQLSIDTLCGIAKLNENVKNCP